MNWSNIKLTQYLDIEQVLSDTSLNDLNKMGRIIKVIYEEDLEDIPLSEMNNRLNEVLELLNEPPRRNKIKKYYEINGKKFKLTDFKKLSFAQFFDASYLFNKNENLDLVMNKFLSIFLIPADKEKYNVGYDLEEVQRDLWNINVEDSNGISFFLVALLKKQYQRGLLYLIARTIVMRGVKWKKKKEAIKLMVLGYQALDYSIS